MLIRLLVVVTVLQTCRMRRSGYARTGRSSVAMSSEEFTTRGVSGCGTYAVETGAMAAAGLAVDGGTVPARRGA